MTYTRTFYISRLTEITDRLLQCAFFYEIHGTAFTTIQMDHAVILKVVLIGD